MTVREPIARLQALTSDFQDKRAVLSDHHGVHHDLCEPRTAVAHGNPGGGTDVVVAQHD